ncbi:MAG: biopolymer transporter ExbD [Pseudomonadota bacterium]
MRIELDQRRRKYPSLTSLIDIIFLLLLFFMLSSTFSKYSEVELTAARIGSGTSADRPELFISLVGKNWRINGEVADFSNALEILSRYQSDTKVSAILRVNETVSSQTLIDAVELLNQQKITVTLVR